MLSEIGNSLKIDHSKIHMKTQTEWIWQLDFFQKPFIIFMA